MTNVILNPVFLSALFVLLLLTLLISWEMIHFTGLLKQKMFWQMQFIYR